MALIERKIRNSNSVIKGSILLGLIFIAIFIFKLVLSACSFGNSFECHEEQSKKEALEEEISQLEINISSIKSNFFP